MKRIITTLMCFCFCFNLLAQIQIYSGQSKWVEPFSLYLYENDKLEFNIDGFENVKLTIHEYTGSPNPNIENVSDGYILNIDKEGGYIFTLEMKGKKGSSWSIDYINFDTPRPIKAYTDNGYKYVQNKKDTYRYKKERADGILNRMLASIDELSDLHFDNSRLISKQTIEVNDYSFNSFDSVGELDSEGFLINPEMNYTVFYFEKGDTVSFKLETVLDLFPGTSQYNKAKQLGKLKNGATCEFVVEPINLWYGSNSMTVDQFPVRYGLILDDGLMQSEKTNERAIKITTDPTKWKYQSSHHIGSSNYYRVSFSCDYPELRRPMAGYQLEVYSKKSESREIKQFISAYNPWRDKWYLEPAEMINR